MFAKTILLLFHVTLFVKNNEGAGLFPNPLELEAQMNRDLANVINEAQKISSEATIRARELLADINAFGEQRLKDAEKSLQQLTSQTEVTLNNAVVKSGGLIDKIGNCTQKYEIELQEYGSSAFKNITGCVTEKIDRGIKIVRSIIEASITITNTAIGLPKRLNDSCPLNNDNIIERIGQLICALVVIGTTSTEVVGQGIVISANVADAVALIASLSTIQVDLPTCFVTRTLSAVAAFVPVVTPIVACTLT